MPVSTALTLPIGLAVSGAAMVAPWLLLADLGIAFLSSALPYALGMEAMRRVPAHVFSASPAAAVGLYVRMMVDEVVIGGEEILMRGSKKALEHAVFAGPRRAAKFVLLYGIGAPDMMKMGTQIIGKFALTSAADV